MSCCNKSVAQVVDMVGIGRQAGTPFGSMSPLALIQGATRRAPMPAPPSARAGHADEHGGACCASCARGGPCGGSTPSDEACPGGVCPVPAARAMAVYPAGQETTPATAPAPDYATPIVTYLAIGAVAYGAAYLAYNAWFRKSRRRR